MQNVSTINIRVAKNAIFLYARTIVVLIVALYTSRLLLLSLGDVDLGVFNLVGGIVALFFFLRSAQSKATSRFITYDIGKNATDEQARKTFSACVSIHLLIAFVILIIGEIVGLWIVNHLIDIPIERYFAANLVFQCALLNFCIKICQVPYEAVIIAHEEMYVVAYLAIAEALIQLALILFLQQTHGDRLVLYGVLLLVEACVLILLHIGYVKIKHKTYRCRLEWNNATCKRILSFSGWTIVGSSTNTLTQQGVSILMNNFVGIIANTALGFANQVNGAVQRFVGSFTTAFNPQIVKLYAQGDSKRLKLLINRSSKFSFVLAYLMALPLIMNMEFVLSVWLDHIPEYTTAFCQLILICSVIDATTGVYNTTITATGDIKRYQISISLSFLLDVVCAYLLLSFSVNPVLVFGSRIFTRGILNGIIGLHFIKRKLNCSILGYCRSVLLPVTLTFIITFPVTTLICQQTNGWISLFSSTLINSVLCCVCTWLIICTKAERNGIIEIVLNKLHQNARK